MSSDERPGVGRRGEQLACEHLTRLGYDILDRNFRTRWGELDIVAGTDTTLVFCEVKTRRGAGRETRPLEAVNPAKRNRVRKMAGRWLIDRRPRPYARELRFDAIGVVVDDAGRLLSLEHVEGGF